MDQKQLKQLQDEWAQKLKDSGFEDIEQPDGNLRHWHSRLLYKRYSDPNSYRAKEYYYIRAGQFLHEHTFEAEHIKEIWALHSEGTPVRDISDIMKAKGIKKLGRDTVHKIIQKLAKKMMENE